MLSLTQLLYVCYSGVSVEHFSHVSCQNVYIIPECCCHVKPQYYFIEQLMNCACKECKPTVCH